DSVLKYVAFFNYEWDENTNVIELRNGGGFTMSWKTTGMHVVTLVTESDSGCRALPYADTVNVRDYPAVKIERLSDDNVVCTKSTIELKTKLVPGATRYEWSPADYFLTNNTTEVRARIHSSGYIKLRVEDAYGCSGADSVYVGIKLCCKAILPTAFSPNNDGKNDKFGIISSGNYKIYAFTVVNRYGRVVFSTTNQQDRWDGTYNGAQQGVGTYYYYIKYTCEDDDADNVVEERGDVTLIR
ncbi:MAG: gliding motility-associated C-terminal domain-containing protein, partial [Taibaiella sp.]|nr:gliding motility-associated C-terminal domain-containing protein [Taibaiella sp.]